MSSLVSQLVSQMWSGILCPPCWACLSLVSSLVSRLGCSVRLSGLAFLLSPVLSPRLSIWSGMLCPPLCFHCPLSPSLSHLVWDTVAALLGLSFSFLGSCLPACRRSAWDAVSAFLVLSLSFSCLRSCLSACLPSGLGCCVRLTGLVFLLSPVLPQMLCPPAWACLSLLFGLVSQILRPPPWYCFLVCQLYLLLSFVLSPQLSPISSGMLCSPPRACLFLVSGLVSRLSPIWSGVLCSPPWACLSPQAVCCWGSPCFLVCLPRLEYCVRLAGLVFLVFQLVWDAVSVLWACLRNLMCDLCNCLGSTVV